MNTTSRSTPPSTASNAMGFATVDPVRLLKRYYPWLIVAAVVGAVVGGASHFILAKLWPFYTSTATFLCKPMPGSTIDMNQGTVNAEDFTRFIGTQAAFMTSSRVLERAVGDPDLEHCSWADQFKYKGQLQTNDAQVALRKSISARPRTATNLIDLSMSYRDPDAVRLVVDAVAKAYVDEYKRDNNLESVGRAQALNTQITALDNQIRSLQESRERQLRELKVTDLKEGLATEDVKTMRLNETLVMVSRDLATTTALLNKYEAMASDSAVINYPEEMRSDAKKDPVLLALEQQLALTRTDERALLESGYGPEHHAVIAVRKRVEAFEQEVRNTEERVLRKIFDAEIDRLRTQRGALEGQQKKLTDDLVEISIRKQDLTQLRVKLEQIDNDIKRYTLDRAELVNGRTKVQTLLSQDVFSRVAEIQSPQVPNEMSFPQLKILVPLGAILGLGFVGGGLLLREVLDQRVKGPADLAMIPRLRVLGMVPDAAEDPVRAANVETAFRDAPQGVVAESFRQLRAPLVKRMETDGYKTLLVLSGMPGSGSTTVASNLAIACAGAGDRVLVIDGNLRRPAIHRVFGVADAPGLGDCLAGQSLLSDAIRPTNFQNLSVLTAGSATNRLLPERLSSEAMTRILAEASTHFDRVIVDAPPAIVAGDGIALANKCDAVTLVVRAMSEKRGLVNRLRMQLTEVRGDMIGVIVNAVRSSAGGYFKKNIQATHEYQSQNR